MLSVPALPMTFKTNKLQKKQTKELEKIETKFLVRLFNFKLSLKLHFVYSHKQYSKSCTFRSSKIIHASLL